VVNGCQHDGVDLVHGEVEDVACAIELEEVAALAERPPRPPELAPLARRLVLLVHGHQERTRKLRHRHGAVRVETAFLE